MSFYPFNKNLARYAKTDVSGVLTDLKSVVHRLVGSPAVPDVDFLVVSTNMKVGTYTLAQTVLAVARNVTITVVKADAFDTPGTVLVTGTGINGASLTETIIPADGLAVGLKAFKTIVSIVGDGWVIGGGTDQISFGFGDVLGLPDKLAQNTVLFAAFNAVREAVAPTVTFSSTVLALNTVDLNSASNGSTVEVWYIP